MVGNFWQPGLAVLAVCAWLCSTAWLVARDNESPAEKPLPAEAAPIDAVAPKGDKKPSTEKPAARDKSTPDKAASGKSGEALDGKAEPALDDELLRSLKAKSDVVNDEVDRLERAINGMRAAQSKIDGKDTGKDTREIQSQVVKDLDDIISAIQQQMNQPPPPSDQNKDKKKKNKNKNQQLTALQQKNQQQQQQAQRQKAAKQQQAEEEAARAREKQKKNQGKDSDENLDPTKAAADEEARRQQMVKDVWGHLPPALRTELLNVYSEKYLPKYEAMVRRYYESLAEKNKQNRPAGR